MKGLQVPYFVRGKMSESNLNKKRKLSPTQIVFSGCGGGMLTEEQRNALPPIKNPSNTFTFQMNKDKCGSNSNSNSGGSSIGGGSSQIFRFGL